MCGIAGILHFDNSRLAEVRLLDAMQACLSHRGPDDEGIFTDVNLGLAHRRLSILDLSENGHQPFSSPDGRFHIVFNGEIYNFEAFYSELTAKGYRFRSHSDTEVLLYLFIEYGPSMLNQLNGMFAFAVWDSFEKQLFLCRDRMGVKPLYYSLFDNSLYFASEEKALLVVGVSADIAEDNWDEFLLYLFVAGSNTLFKYIRKLLPGHYLVLKDGKISLTRWWNLSERIKTVETEANPFEWFESTFDDAIRYRMVSDVPVGVLLSGGLDSGSVLTSLHSQGYKISTFNIGFNHPDHNEANLAGNLASQWNSPFQTLTIEGEQLHQAVEDSSWHNDGPLVHQNDPHLLAISRLAKRHVSVLLSGEGADELMAGYVRHHFFRYHRHFSVLGTLLGLLNYSKNNWRFNKLKRYLTVKDKDDLILLNGSNLFPEDFKRLGFIHLESQAEYRQQILQEAKSVYPSEPERQLLYVDQHTYLCSLLDRNDRTTMGASIECREPYLDYRLVEGLASLPMALLNRGKKGKYILFNTIGKRLPPEITSFRKIGLSVPWNEYLTNEPCFRQELDELPHSSIFSMGCLSQIDIDAIIQAFQKGDKSAVALVQQLVMINIWHRTYFKRVANYRPAELIYT